MSDTRRPSVERALAIQSAPRPRRRRGKDVARPFAIEAARLLNDRHFQDVIVFDVRELSDVTDYVLIATGASDRQIISVGSEMRELATGFDLIRSGIDADDPVHWVVLDFFDVVAHLFDAQTRGFYDLEMMWGDAPRLRWRRLKPAASTRRDQSE